MTPLFSPFFSPFWGVCVGSFLNVCLHRWKNGGQIVSPASFCPHCKKSILWFDNIPLLSFCLLRGKCRFCQKPISLQYPLIEALTGLLFLLSSLIFFEKSPQTVVLSYLFTSYLVLLAASDLKWKLLPHVFTNLFILTGFLALGLPSSPVLGPALFSAVTDFIVTGSLLFGFIQFFPNGLGGGDIKMMAGLAVWVGLVKSLFIFVFACVLASLVFFGLKFLNKISWKWMMPFGPFLSLGALLVWVFPGIADQLTAVLTRIN